MVPCRDLVPVICNHIWATSVWDRPLSPTARHPGNQKNIVGQTSQNVPAWASSTSNNYGMAQQDRPATAPEGSSVNQHANTSGFITGIDVLAEYEEAPSCTPHEDAMAMQECQPSASFQQHAASASCSLTVTYYGIAGGELGALSQKQVRVLGHRSSHKAWCAHNYAQVFLVNTRM